MGLFNRLGDIMTANLHALLDQVEDPVRMLNQLIREMEEGLAGARRQAVSLVAAERRLLREVERHRESARSWKERASLALDSGREDLACRAIARQLEQEDLAQSLASRHVDARRQREAGEEMLRTLQQRLEDARRHRHSLELYQQGARTRIDWLAASDAGGNSAFARFTRLESRLKDLQDDLIVQAEITNLGSPADADFERLEAQHRIAHALTVLKAERQSRETQP